MVWNSESRGNMGLVATRRARAELNRSHSPVGRVLLRTAILAAVSAIVTYSACTPARDRSGKDEPDRNGAGSSVASPSDFPAPALSFLVNGDMLLTRLPGKRMAEKGIDFLFEKVKPLIEAADIAFGNLECPISTSGSPYPNKPPGVTFRASPEAAAALGAAGYDVVSLANNHMNDYGELAVVDTLRYLSLAAVATAGAGRTASESRTAAMLVRSGYTIALLAYAEPVWSVVEARDPPWPKALATLPPRPEAKQLGPGRAGTAIVREDTVRADIAALREKPGVDIVAVSFHWGDEHARVPNSYQRRIARLAVDAGADLVIGHHPHVLQGIELYKGGIVLYSLGNFIFDMDPDATYDSVAVILRIDREKTARARIVAFDIVPVRVARGLCRPAPAKGEDRERITEFLAESSRRFGTTLVPGSSSFRRLVEGPEWEPSLHWSRSTRP